MYNVHTVVGFSRGVSISALLKKTFPRQALHRIRSNTDSFSRAITPVTNLYKYIYIYMYVHLVSFILTLSLSLSLPLSLHSRELGLCVGSPGLLWISVHKCLILLLIIRCDLPGRVSVVGRSNSCSQGILFSLEWTGQEIVHTCTYTIHFSIPSRYMKI
jgi:hypothetical protein